MRAAIEPLAKLAEQLRTARSGLGARVNPNLTLTITSNLTLTLTLTLILTLTLALTLALTLTLTLILTLTLALTVAPSPGQRGGAHRGRGLRGVYAAEGLQPYHAR